VNPTVGVKKRDAGRGKRPREEPSKSKSSSGYGNGRGKGVDLPGPGKKKRVRLGFTRPKKPSSKNRAQTEPGKRSNGEHMEEGEGVYKLAGGAGWDGGETAPQKVRGKGTRWPLLAKNRCEGRGRERNLLAFPCSPNRDETIHPRPRNSGENKANALNRIPLTDGGDRGGVRDY